MALAGAHRLLVLTRNVAAHNPNFLSLPRACNHELRAHVSHLEQVSDDELDRLLGIVVDVENLFMCVHKVPWVCIRPCQFIVQ